jgi:hypothetical protein
MEWGCLKKGAADILSRNGIENPTAGTWYPQQNWLNAFKEIAEKVGFSSLFVIGKAIPESAKFPPDIDSLEKALSAIDIAYHMNHKNGDIGFYRFEKTSPTSGKILCNNPYPCDFDMGIIKAMCQRFKDKDTLSVLVDHDTKCACRKTGGDSCTYNISW